MSNDICPCGACLDDEPHLCIQFRYPAPELRIEDADFPIDGDECCCSCHEIYYRRINEQELEEEFPNEY